MTHKFYCAAAGGRLVLTCWPGIAPEALQRLRLWTWLPEARMVEVVE